MCMDHWHCTARIESDGSGGVPAIALGPRKGARRLNGSRPRGWTSAGTGLSDGERRRRGDGDIRSRRRRAAPAPLVDVDTPAHRLSPALVSPESVSLYPLIPAGDDGSLSREDMLQAIDGLSETATVERWDGTAWDALATVDLLRVPGDSLPRSATLPALEPAHTGSFVKDPKGLSTDLVDESL